ncbi:MAG: alpha/beta fold hydrolase [Planctomycetota bacterium]
MPASRRFKLVRFRTPFELAGSADRVPVVLAHGFLGSGNTRLGPISHRYFYGVENTINDREHPVLVTRVSSTGPIRERAATLAEQIKAWTATLDNKRKPIVVAHSMGGLDTRFALTHLGLAEHVDALATVATPHRGSPFADWAMAKFSPRLRAVGNFLRKRTGIDLRGSDELTNAYAEVFNEQTPDVPGVAYFSIAAVRERAHTFPGLRFSHDIITRAEGENDGLVSRWSAKWGTFLGDWACDHTHSRNQRFREKHPEPTGDVGPLYQRLVDDVVAAIG